MKKIILTFLFFLISFQLTAQQTAILKPNGRLLPLNESKIKKEFTKLDKLKNQNNEKVFYSNKQDDFDDTLKYFNNWNVIFNFSGQEWLLQWFQAPTDLTLKKIGFACAENPDSTNIEIKVVKLNWLFDQLSNQTATRHGYYEATGNGYNDITAFLDNPDRTGGWTSIQSDGTEPYAEDIWSNNGVGYSVLPVENNTMVGYQWVDLSSEPVIAQGEIFGITIKNSGVDSSSSKIKFRAGESNGFPGWKFYLNGRLEPGVDYGWWSREYTFDFAAVVEYGSGCFIYINPAQLNTTTSIEPRLVQATIYGPNPDPSYSVDAKLNYSTDKGSTWFSSQMDYLGDNNYSDTIPGFPVHTQVEYYVTAYDSLPGCFGSSSQIFSYFIFGPSGAKTLVAFNGFDGMTNGFPQDYYFGTGDFIDYTTFKFDYDAWAYGPLTPEVVNSYTNIIEISNSDGGPTEYNNDVIRDWIAANPDHNYMLVGQEWLGAGNGYTDTNYIEGDFEYDILGLTHSYNDVSYDGTSGQELPSLVIPIQGSLLCDSLYTLFNSMPTDSLVYNPVYEIGFGTQNWIDGFDVAEGVDVDMTVESRAIGSPHQVPDVRTLNCIAHHTLAAGNKIAFMSLDPIAIDTKAGTDDYYWYGFTTAAPQVQVLRWFGADVVDVKKIDNVIPDKYSLSQNYPNPFNPTTNIGFRIANFGLITLKVYDVLGREVATIVNEEKPAVSYNVNFDASALSSGVYFYQLRTGNYSSVKKMILLK